MEGDENNDFIHNFIDRVGSTSGVCINDYWCNRWYSSGSIRRPDRMRVYCRIDHQTVPKGEMSSITGAPFFFAANEFAKKTGPIMGR